MPSTDVIEPSHFGMCVSDIDRALRFYCDGLGFAAGDGYDLDSTAAPGLDHALEVPGPVSIRSQFIALGDMRIELIRFADRDAEGEPSSRRTQLGVTHLSFWVDDVDATAARLVEHGGTLLESTRTNPGVELMQRLAPAS
ncbi:MAG: VOC family protein [Acidimicrobiia bacterium]